MLLALTLLHVSFFLFLFFIIRFKEYKKSLSIFLLIVCTLFYTPIFYYSILDGQVYRIFNEKDLEYFILISSAVFIQFAILLLIKNAIKIKPLNKSSYLNGNINVFVNVYVMLIVALVFLYLIVFFNQLPLYQTLLTGSAVERPDISGSLPGYFTFSVFSSLIIPGFYFYYLDLINKNKLVKLLLIVTISLLMVAGGNKGLLVYFYIFLWIFEYRLKINVKVILMIVSSFFIYLFLKTGEIKFTQENWEYMTTSPFRRFFVTQGVGFIARIQLLSANFDFTTIESVKNYVFSVIYGGVGSHPTYFLADIIIKFGIYLGVLVHLVIISIIFYLSRIIDKNYQKNLFVIWNFVIICFLLGMAEISDSFFLRTLAITMNILIISLLSRIKR